MIQRNIRSEVFLRSDLRNVLLAIQWTNDSLTEQVPFDDTHSYRAGFAAAIQAIATAFGVEPEVSAVREVTAGLQTGIIQTGAW